MKSNPAGIVVRFFSMTLPTVIANERASKIVSRGVAKMVKVAPRDSAQRWILEVPHPLHPMRKITCGFFPEYRVCQGIATASILRYFVRRYPGFPFPDTLTARLDWEDDF